jgi:hypothetical protein
LGCVGGGVDAAESGDVDGLSTVTAGGGNIFDAGGEGGVLSFESCCETDSEDCEGLEGINLLDTELIGRFWSDFDRLTGTETSED